MMLGRLRYFSMIPRIVFSSIFRFNKFHRFFWSYSKRFLNNIHKCYWCLLNITVHSYIKFSWKPFTSFFYFPLTICLHIHLLIFVHSYLFFIFFVIYFFFVKRYLRCLFQFQDFSISGLLKFLFMKGTWFPLVTFNFKREFFFLMCYMKYSLYKSLSIRFWFTLWQNLFSSKIL